jgi:hypothetical protein
MRRRLVIFLILMGALYAFLWKGYGEVLSIHLDVLSGMVDKIAWQVDLGRRPSPNDLTELIYPLRRAREFEEQYEDRAESESYQRFRAFVARYERLIERIDRTRGKASEWVRGQDLLLRHVAKLRLLEEGVRAALAREEGG